MRLLRALLILTCATLASHGARAQFGLEGSPEELEAFDAVRRGRFVRARELAEALVRAHPDSYVGHYVLAVAQHEGEANVPVAYREAQEGLRLFAARYHDPPDEGAPFRWHMLLLQELIQIEGDMERHAERIDTLDRYDRLYQPRMLAERAWSLMKLRRFEAARRAAREALASEQTWQVEMGLNALCAIEFEAGLYGRSYEACQAALEYGRNSPDGPSVVDITNFAEAARTELRLAESEAMLREASTMEDGGYGNPWLELGELYVREGRLGEALDALREVPPLRERRAPSMRDSDRAESMRALASFYLVAGRPRDAVRIAEQALRAPDRRGHNSRDPAQDRAIVALFHRHAVRYLARAVAAESAGGSLLDRLAGWVEVARLELEAWESGRRILQFLSDRTRLVGILRIGLSTGGISPSFLIEDLCDIMGPGAFLAAVEEARRGDRRPASAAYYDAMAVEARVRVGDDAQAERLAVRALAALPAEEGLLRARVLTKLGEARWDRGERGPAGAAFASAYAIDPTAIRRLRVPLPVRLSVRGAAGVDSALARASELDVDVRGVADLRVDVSGRSAHACLQFHGGAARCVDVAPERGENARSFRERLAGAVLDRLLGPELRIAPTDVAELEGPIREAHQRLRIPLP